MSSMAPFLLPKANNVVVRVGVLDDVVVGGVVAAAEGAGLDRRASTTASAARTPRVPTTSRVTPVRKPQRIRAGHENDSLSVTPAVFWTLPSGCTRVAEGPPAKAWDRASTLGTEPTGCDRGQLEPDFFALQAHQP